MNVAQTKELLQKCISAEMSLDEVKDYLSTDLDEEPEAWIKGKGKREGDREKQVEKYAKDRFENAKGWTDRE